MVVITGTILAAVLIIGMISGGAVLITAYWRDVETKKYEAEIGIDRNQTLDEIMEDDSIPDDEKTKILMEYLGTSAPSSFDFGELSKYIPVVIVGYVAAAMLGGKK